MRPEAPGERGCWSPRHIWPPAAPPSSRGHLLCWGSPMSHGALPGLEESSTCSRQNTPHISHTTICRAVCAQGCFRPLSQDWPRSTGLPLLSEGFVRSRRATLHSPAASLQARFKPHLQTPCLPAWLLCVRLEGCKALDRPCLVLQPGNKLLFSLPVFIESERPWETGQH